MRSLSVPSKDRGVARGKRIETRRRPAEQRRCIRPDARFFAAPPFGEELFESVDEVWRQTGGPIALGRCGRIDVDVGDRLTDNAASFAANSAMLKASGPVSG